MEERENKINQNIKAEDGKENENTFKEREKKVGCSKEIFEHKIFRERKTDAQIWKAKRQIFKIKLIFFLF